MSYVYHQQNAAAGGAFPNRTKVTKPFELTDQMVSKKPAGPFRYGIKINRPKTDSMADKALQIEANRAKRYVGELNQELKLPTPRTPAVLAYLRWLDKMDAWYRRSGSLHQTSARLRETEDLYSWNAGFGEPIVLPRIRKHPNPEKYYSKQIEKKYQDPNLLTSVDARNYEEVIKKKRMQRQAKAETKNADRGFGIASQPRSEEESGRTKFYIHAMNNFKYWPMELYDPPIHHTKYSFGSQFNPGRAGVVTDRIYARPRANKHYWTEFQLRQNPIGSGNNVTGKVLAN